MAPDTIYGRARELARVADFCASEPIGSRALVIEGTAGIGKTTLWREAIRRAQTKGSVVSARASESESMFSFSVLGDLMEPVAGNVLPELPAQQRRALEAALVIGDAQGATPDARAVGLATVAAIRALAVREPLTIAIDDVQWADPPSFRVLSFAFRRLEAERTSIVLTYRTDRERPTAPLLDPETIATETIVVGPVGSVGGAGCATTGCPTHAPP